MASLPEPKGKQREVLALPGIGHHVVLGTAGSGKTVMAIHRAASLGHPVHSKFGRVLLVTFNRSLVTYLRYWQPAALEHVTIEHFHAFAKGYLSSRGMLGYGDICSNDV